jgi:hypothetical protein
MSTATDSAGSLSPTHILHTDTPTLFQAPLLCVRAWGGIDVRSLDTSTPLLKNSIMPSPPPSDLPSHTETGKRCYIVHRKGRELRTSTLHMEAPKR